MFYSFSSRSVDYALPKAQSLLTELCENSGFNFINPSESDGQKVWYHGLPFIVLVKRKDEPWRIDLKPDFEDFDGTEELFWVKYRDVVSIGSHESDSEWIDESIHWAREYGIINHGDAFQDRNIKWFRQ